MKIHTIDMLDCRATWFLTFLLLTIKFANVWTSTQSHRLASSNVKRLLSYFTLFLYCWCIPQKLLQKINWQGYIYIFIYIYIYIYIYMYPQGKNQQCQ